MGRLLRKWYLTDLKAAASSSAGGTGEVIFSKNNKLMQNTACNFSGNQYNYYCCLIDNNKIAMPQWRNWQTRNVQVVVWVSMYRFESCLGHFLCFLCFYTIAKRWYKGIFIFHETLKNVFNTHFAEKVRKKLNSFLPSVGRLFGRFFILPAEKSAEKSSPNCCRFALGCLNCQHDVIFKEKIVVVGDTVSLTINPDTTTH